MNRRKFVNRTMVGSAAVSTLGVSSMAFTKSKRKGIPIDQLFVGTMLIPQAIYEMGIPESLDAMYRNWQESIR